jgi:ribosomal-protein-alanine N-acetyltransferase
MQLKSIIRRARLADVDRIVEIEDSSFGGEAYDRKLFAEFFHSCGELFLVSERDGKVGGYMISCIRGEEAELVSLAVDPSARSKGVASALMESTLRRLRRRSIRRISLTVKVTNAKARSLYQRYGFEQVKKAPLYYGKSGNVWHMAKDL